MKKALIGAGGFAQEVKAHINDDDIVFFVEDRYFENNDKLVHPLSTFNPEIYEVLIAIGDPITRKRILDILPQNTKFFSFIHPSAILLDPKNKIGEGTIICAGCILTTNIKIGKHCHLNLQTTIGHNCEIGDFFTTAPGAKISGDCMIDDLVYIGTNSSIKQKISICEKTTIGLNTGVVKNIYEPGVYVGTPAKKIK